MVGIFAMIHGEHDEQLPNGPFIFEHFIDWICWVCAPGSLGKAEIEAFAASAIPRPAAWIAIDKGDYRLGKHTPNRCNHSGRRRHWFLVLESQIARLEQLRDDA